MADTYSSSVDRKPKNSSRRADRERNTQTEDCKSEGVISNRPVRIPKADWRIPERKPCSQGRQVIDGHSAAVDEMSDTAAGPAESMVVSGQAWAKDIHTTGTIRKTALDHSPYTAHSRLPDRQMGLPQHDFETRSPATPDTKRSIVEQASSAGLRCAIVSPKALLRHSPPQADGSFGSESKKPFPSMSYRESQDEYFAECERTFEASSITFWRCRLEVALSRVKPLSSAGR